MIKYDIYHNDNEVGFITGYLAENSEMIEIGGIGNPSLSTQMAELGIDESYPASVFYRVEIYESYQNKGFGKAAIRFFLERSKQLGAHWAIGHVGFDNQEEMQKNVSIYQKTGWTVYAHRDGMRVQLPLTDESWCVIYYDLRGSFADVDRRILDKLRFENTFEAA